MNTTNMNKVRGNQNHSMQLRPRRFPGVPVPVPILVATTFPIFSKLPPEIRSMIWKFAQPQRIILATPPGAHSELWNPMHLSGPTRVLNAVCREAQVETEKAYNKLTVYRRRDFAAGVVVTDDGQFPFNPSVDTLYARDKGYGEHASYFIEILEDQPEGQEIKKLAIWEARLLEHSGRHLEAFMKLEELTIVVGKTTGDTRSKILRFGFELDLEQEVYGGPNWEGRDCDSGWWGRGSTADHVERWDKLWHLMFELREIDKREEGLKMPTVRIMVLNEKDFKPRSF